MRVGQTKLLDKNPETRLGSGADDAKALKSDPFFKDIKWQKLLNKKIKPPFIPDLVCA